MTKLIRKSGHYKNEWIGENRLWMPTNSTYRIKRRTTRTII